MKRRYRTIVALALLSLAAPALVPAADAERQQEVAKRGAEVMPFDLDQTTHFFEPLKDGGRQRVTVKDPKNKTQIALIQAHLKDEANRFARGDFSDPMKIHDADMPGLAELSRGAGHMNVRYVALPNGAEIRYTTKDHALVEAIHRWFQAQLHDHGRHATTHSHQ